MAENQTTQTNPTGPVVDRRPTAEYAAYKAKFRSEPKSETTTEKIYSVNGQEKVKTYRVMTFKDGVTKKVLISTTLKK